LPRLVLKPGYGPEVMGNHIAYDSVIFV